MWVPRHQAQGAHACSWLFACLLNVNSGPNSAKNIACRSLHAVSQSQSSGVVNSPKLSNPCCSLAYFSFAQAGNWQFSCNDHYIWAQPCTNDCPVRFLLFWTAWCSPASTQLPILLTELF